MDYTGGAAGSMIGETGHSTGSVGAGGGGGTQSGGGAGGTHAPDTAGTTGGLGFGGRGNTTPSLVGGGGGGGGYYGGGGGSHGGGGGGSSYVNRAIARNVSYSTPLDFSGITISYDFPTLPNSIEDIPVIEFAGIAPNPSTDDARLELVLGTGSDLNISVIELTGRTIWANSVFKMPGRQVIQLPSSSLEPGVYLVHITGTKSRYDKVLKWMKN